MAVTIGSLIAYSTGLSVALALIAFIVSAAIDRNKPLHDHLARSAAASAVPSAIVLICAAFDMSILSRVQGMNIPIAFGGMSLLWISIRAAFQRS